MSKPATESPAKKPKILNIIADVAAGHRSGAEALERSFAKAYPGKYEVKTIDIFKLADIQPYNALEIVQDLATANRWVEKALDIGIIFPTKIKLIYDIYSKYMSWKLLTEMKRIIDEEDPAAVVSVHPFGSMILKMLKDKYPEEIKYKTISMVTDLVTLFRGWGDINADLVTAPTAKAANTLVKFGVNIDKILYPVFPIKPELANYRDKDVVMKELGFSSRKHTVMITGGGFGLKSMLKAVQDLVRDVDLQLIIITGKAEFLKQQLEIRYKNFERIKVFGFVTNIQDYINVSDIVVTKPGPATILEVELFNKAAILTKNIGHQEIGNIYYALTNPRFRYIGENWSSIKKKVYELIEQKNAGGDNDANGDRTELPATSRRSFDECDQIAKKIVEVLES